MLEVDLIPAECAQLGDAQAVAVDDQALDFLGPRQRVGPAKADRAWVRSGQHLKPRALNELEQALRRGGARFVVREKARLLVGERH